MALAIWLNIAVQVIFCVVVAVAFLDPPFPDRESFIAWRNNVGHNVANQDQITMLSLVSRVCGNDKSLATSVGQRSTLEAISRYLEAPPITTLGQIHESVNVGVVLCMLVLLLWFLTVAYELRQSISFTRAVWLIPKAKQTTLLRAGDDAVVLQAIGTPRLIFISFLILARFCVATSLLFMGALWQVNTIDIRDMVLNAAALGFHLGI
eukprot:gnl/TRDRNA2_/TRDRNA2_140479_c2_seq1.p1 gnl/TRDRNA2_/TRDRNA2_140479_c2~~gnl/TRDRNA2_/TRDRNA2_140479_c2_seq1.p1  ORF type:complete len:221 (-),score=15.67 gnl/TRDRNA2_/TRDRNA2_140479_c2_seq1:27-650(-)